MALWTELPGDDSFVRVSNLCGDPTPGGWGRTRLWGGSVGYLVPFQPVSKSAVTTPLVPFQPVS